MGILLFLIAAAIPNEKPSLPGFHIAPKPRFGNEQTILPMFRFGKKRPG
jgi:hypothetical protein